MPFIALSLGKPNLTLISAQDSAARSTPIQFTSSADTSILPIVTSQRDRFRQRNAELEDVRSPLDSLGSHLPGSVDSLPFGFLRSSANSSRLYQNCALKSEVFRLIISNCMRRSGICRATARTQQTRRSTHYHLVRHHPTLGN